MLKFKDLLPRHDYSHSPAIASYCRLNQRETTLLRSSIDQKVKALIRQGVDIKRLLHGVQRKLTHNMGHHLPSSGLGAKEGTVHAQVKEVLQEYKQLWEQRYDYNKYSSSQTGLSSVIMSELGYPLSERYSFAARQMTYRLLDGEMWNHQEMVPPDKMWHVKGNQPYLRWLRGRIPYPHYARKNLTHTLSINFTPEHITEPGFVCGTAFKAGGPDGGRHHHAVWVPENWAIRTAQYMPVVGFDASFRPCLVTHACQYMKRSMQPGDIRQVVYTKWERPIERSRTTLGYAYLMEGNFLGLGEDRKEAEKAALNAAAMYMDIVL